VFIEVKKPNNPNGINAEIIRAKERFNNNKFKTFFNLTQIIIYSNNVEYDELAPQNGAFYSTAYSQSLNHFYEPNKNSNDNPPNHP